MTNDDASATKITIAVKITITIMVDVRYHWGPYLMNRCSTMMMYAVVAATRVDLLQLKYSLH